jgi:hypothetical protein
MLICQGHEVAAAMIDRVIYGSRIGSAKVTHAVKNCKHANNSSWTMHDHTARFGTYRYIATAGIGGPCHFPEKQESSLLGAAAPCERLYDSTIKAGACEDLWKGRFQPQTEYLIKKSSDVSCYNLKMDWQRCSASITACIRSASACSTPLLNGQPGQAQRTTRDVLHRVTSKSIYIT